MRALTLLLAAFLALGSSLATAQTTAPAKPAGRPGNTPILSPGVKPTRPAPAGTAAQPKPAATAATPAAATPPPAATEPSSRVAGELAMVTGGGTASSADGTVRNVAKGDRFYSGDIINTGRGSFINLKFTDGSFVLLRPGTRFQVEEYRYTPVAVGAAPATADQPATGAAAPAARTVAASSSSRAYFRLLKGGFRAVSGLIGGVDKSQYKVSTAVATIGIRGTDYNVYLCDAACAADPVVAAAFGASGGAVGGVLVGVISGGVFMANDTSGQVTEVPQGGYAITLPDGSSAFLPFAPEAIRAIEQMPAPEACQ